MPSYTFVSTANAFALRGARIRFKVAYYIFALLFLLFDIETLFLTPAEQYSYLSSSLVREVASLGGDVSPFVHEKIVAELTRKLR